jgi:hypothetical protein
VKTSQDGAHQGFSKIPGALGTSRNIKITILKILFRAGELFHLLSFEIGVLWVLVTALLK